MPKSVIVRTEFRLEPWSKTQVEFARPGKATLSMSKSCLFLHPKELRTSVHLIRLYLRHLNLYVATLENRSCEVVRGELGAQFKEGQS